MSKLYTDFKIFHYDSKLKDLSNNVISAPIHIRIKPTNRCNHNCNYCCYRNENLLLSELIHPQDELPWDKMQEIIQDLTHMGVKAVTFSGGGEPLFYPYIEQSFNLLIKNRIKIGLLTNGSLLTGSIARLLAQKASWIRISMDAVNAQSYAQTRSVQPSEFDKVCRNIQEFANIPGRKAQLGINFIVTKENYKDIYTFLKKMKTLGVDHVKVSEVVISTSKQKNRTYHKPLFTSVCKELKKAKKDLEDQRFQIINKYDYFIDKDNDYQKEYTRCPYIQCLTIVGADMNVYTCQDKAYTKSGKLGSIKKKSFKKLWNEPKTKERLLKLNPHKDCLHHCTQDNKNRMIHDYLQVNQDHIEFV